MIAKATFGAGCFWGVEKALQETPGVVRTRVGYVSDVEAVEVVFETEKVSYENLLDKFWSIHSAKKIFSRQYESVIFYHNENQKKIAERKKRELADEAHRQVSTKIEPREAFNPAEERHQNYLKKRLERQIQT